MNTEKQYLLVGFNNAYILAQHEPCLLNTISQNLGAINNYLEVFLEGKKQLEMENVKKQLYELYELRSQSQEREKDFDRG